VTTGNTTGLTGLGGGAGSVKAAGLVQFSGDEITDPVSVMTSGGGADGCVTQPARKTATKMIPANLNTRQLCGTDQPTQADSSSVLLVLILVLVLELILFGDEEDDEAELPGVFPRLVCGAQLRHDFPQVKILVAITGASGALYAQRLLDNLDPRAHEIHVVQSNYAQQVIAEELPGGLRLPDGVKSHGLKSMNAPFASGSNPPDAMVVIPCTMGTMGRIAHGYSEDVLLRAADVVLKEKRKLILVPRETPLSLIHVKNMELLLLAGATILPANPSFYSGAKTAVELADTVVARVLDHLGVENHLAPRWTEEKE